MAGGGAVRLPPRLSLARLPTPLRALERFSALPAGSRVWIKHDELTGTELSGNKIRKLEFTLAEAQQQGCDTLISCGGLQSNHARATAILGARLGMDVHLILRGERPDTPDGNLLLDHLAGATIHYLPQHEYHRHEQLAADLSEDLSKRGQSPFFIPIGASDEIGLWGYVAASAELRDDFREANVRPDAIVCATGSGGTQAGLIAGNALYGLGTQVHAIAVSDDEAYFRNKITRDFQRWQKRYADHLPEGFDPQALPISTIEGYIGPGYGRAEAPVFELIRELARSEGILLDPVYTGKAFLGMLEEMHRGKLQGMQDIVFIHTGGLFGLFPQRGQFNW